MTTSNPFPGMNPFFEQTWRDAHARLITHICEDLQSRLPPDLVARAEEGVAALSAEAKRRYPDVQVAEQWVLKESGAAVATDPPMVADEPIHVLREEDSDRWIEILSASGRLITAIEVLSPANKQGAIDEYLRKRREFFDARVNVVEIDLIRQGTSVFSAPVREAVRRAGAIYGICVFRAAKPTTDEVYPVRLRDRLPTISIPLRETDSDVLLNLQPLINRCHEGGRYHMLNYSAELEPPLSESDAAWMDQLLGQAGLRR
jgi:hypothetical protein